MASGRSLSVLDLIEENSSGADSDSDRARAPEPEISRPLTPKKRWFAFRDSSRRCAFLAHCHAQGRLATVNFEKYRRAILRRMTIFLEGSDHEIAQSSADAILRKFRDFLCLRTRVRRPPKEATPIIIEWETRDHGAVRLRQILESEEALRRYPRMWPNNIVLSRRLPKPMSWTVHNYSKVVTDEVTDEEKDRSNCPCREVSG